MISAYGLCGKTAFTVSAAGGGGGAILYGLFAECLVLLSLG